MCSVVHTIIGRGAFTILAQSDGSCNVVVDGYQQAGYVKKIQYFFFVFIHTIKTFNLVAGYIYDWRFNGTNNVSISSSSTVCDKYF